MSIKVIKNDVYPFSLVVATSVSDLKEINEKYESIDREELKVHECSEAITYPVFEKDTNRSAVCIVFNSKPTIKLIAHESLHATYMVMSILCHIPLNNYEESKKYKTLKEFRENNKGCYESSIQHGWIEDFTWITFRRRKNI